MKAKGTKNTNPAKSTATPESAIKGMTYGAPELKALYKKFMSRGMAFSITFHGLLIGAIMLSIYIGSLNAEKNNEQVEQRVITLDDLSMPTNNTAPEEEQVEVEKVIQKTVKDLSALTPVPTPKMDADVLTTRTQDQLQDINSRVGTEDIDGVENITDGTLTLDNTRIEERIEKDPPVKQPEKEIFKTFEVEKAPSPVNLGSVQSSMRYPEIAITSGTEGRVTVKVLVGKTGNVIKIGKISGPSVFHSEVKSKVYDLAFTPALQNGKNVKCWVSVPFNFKLKSKFGSD